MSTFRALKIRNYRLYFIGQAVSLCGTWMQTIAQDWLVLQLTHSGTQLGVVTALQALPILFFGPYGGVLADRFEKRKVLYLTQSVSGLLALTLGVLVLTNTVQLWMIYILAFSLGLVNVIDNPTRQSFVSEMVEKEHLTNAITLNSTEVNLARAIGPMISGGVIATLGLGLCFFINAFSYLGVLIMLALMSESELRPSPRGNRSPGQLMEGLRYVWRTPLLRDTLIMMAIIGTFAYEFSVSLPLLAEFTFHGGAHTYAYLVAATGIGSGIGGLFAASRKKVHRLQLIISMVGMGLSLLLAAFMPTLSAAIFFLFISGLFSINFLSLANATLQMESEPRMRGRVMALWATAFLGSTPIGGPIIGVIGEYFGPRWSLAVGGLATLITAVFGTYSYLKRTRIKPVAIE